MNVVLACYNYIIHIVNFNRYGHADVAAAAKKYIIDASFSRYKVGGDIDLASSQSYGFFYDVPLDSWNLYRDIYLKHDNHRDSERPMMFSPHDPPYPDNPNPTYNSMRAWYQNNYEPNFSCPFEKRLGGIHMNGDGPKWVCDPHRIRKLAMERKARDPNHPGCVVYSIGSNGDFNFELGIQQEIGEGVCEFHIFDIDDFSQSEWITKLKRVHFHQWGLQKQGRDLVVPEKRSITYWDNRTATYEFFGLSDIIKKLGHESLDMIDIFKIDCESCEWETYNDWLAEGIPTLHQILVEVHHDPGETVLSFFDTLEAAGYLRFHKEPNIMSDPSCLEYGMVKVSTEFMNGKNFTFNKEKYTMVDGHVVGQKL